MRTLTLSLNDTVVARLERQAQKQDISIEEIVEGIVMQGLATIPDDERHILSQERSVEAGIEYVIAKNRELLQRLA
jgi:hypothetical protein